MQTPFFPKDEEIVLAAISAVLAVDYRRILPEDLWDNILKALVTTEKNDFNDRLETTI